MVDDTPKIAGRYTKKSDDTILENIIKLYYSSNSDTFIAIQVDGDNQSYTIGPREGRQALTDHDLLATAKISITYTIKSAVMIANAALPDEDPSEPGVLYAQNGFVKISL